MSLVSLFGENLAAAAFEAFATLSALFGHSATTDLGPLCARPHDCSNRRARSPENLSSVIQKEFCNARGATATNDKLTGNFDSAPEETSISDYRFVALFA
ncbi:hypothetical protein [Bradyrhizobium sp.]|uniref:hypothetical protein n=1 Tax=Bradyrhizobium sp. TaxID=376 RepID=UPI003BB0B85E